MLDYITRQDQLHEARWAPRDDFGVRYRELDAERKAAERDVELARVARDRHKVGTPQRVAAEVSLERCRDALRSARAALRGIREPVS